MQFTASSLEAFTYWAEKKTFSAINNKLFVCGDFNIDLMNPNNHISTEDVQHEFIPNYRKAKQNYVSQCYPH